MTTLASDALLSEELTTILARALAASGSEVEAEMLAGALADSALGAFLPERRLIMEAYRAGIVTAIRGTEASARAKIRFDPAAWHHRLGSSPAAALAVTAWARVLDREFSTGSSWSQWAEAAAAATNTLVVAAHRFSAAPTLLSLVLWRDGQPVADYQGRPDPAAIGFCRRSLRLPAAALVGSDLPRLAEHLGLTLGQATMVDLHEVADRLRRQGRLKIAGALGLIELAAAAGLPAPGETPTSRGEAAAGIWFRLLRPILLSPRLPIADAGA